MAKKEYVKNKRGDIIYPVTKEDLVFDDNDIALSEKLAELSQTANSAYQKPDSGIPASDIAVGVIPDVSNFITASVNNLINYYLKSETYTKAEVNALIRSIQGFSYESVESLPTASANTMGIIYLVPSEDPQTNNVKDEYITLLSGEVGSYTYSWEQIGSTAMSLDGYVTETALNQALSSYVTSSAFTSALAQKQDKLVSGENIKTVNGESILGSGDIVAGDPNAIKYTEQSLTEGQKAQAKENLGIPNPLVTYTPSGEVNPSITPASYATKAELDQLGQEVTDLIPTVFEDGFYIIDSDRNIGFYVDENGIAALIMSVLSTLFTTTNEDGFYIIDSDRNIGFMVNTSGAHSANLVEY